MSGEISYKTHILIGVRPNGIMTVIADWPHVPNADWTCSRRSTRPATAMSTFALCTPTSILSADGNGSASGGWHRPVGPGRR